MDLYTPLTAVGAIVGGIVCLRVFWTLWTLVDRKISGDPLELSKDVQTAELKNTVVTVYFKSGAVLDDVIMKGYLSTHHDAPYDFKQLLILEGSQSRRYYARISEIQYFEDTSTQRDLEPKL